MGPSKKKGDFRPLKDQENSTAIPGGYNKEAWEDFDDTEYKESPTQLDESGDSDDESSSTDVPAGVKENIKELHDI